MAMAFIGFILLGGLGGYFFIGGVVLFLGAAAFGTRGDGWIGLALAAIGLAILWIDFAYAPFSITWGAL